MRISAWLRTGLVTAGLLGLCGAASAQITGNVKLDGKAPKMEPINMTAVPACAAMHDKPILEETVVVDDKGNLANAVVWLTGDNIKASVPAAPVIVEQKGCQYVPHVVAVVVGQKLVARNGDPFLHNVHTLPDNNLGKNLAQVNKEDDDLPSLKVPEVFIVKCDIHPWMKAWIAGVPNQYVAVTGADGNYSIDTKGLADGEYTINVWQEKAKKPDPDKDPCITQKITVKNGKATSDFKVELRVKVASAEPVAPQAAQNVTVVTVECPVCADGKCEKPADPKASAAVTAATK